MVTDTDELLLRGGGCYAQGCDNPPESVYWVSILGPNPGVGCYCSEHDIETAEWVFELY